MKERALSVGVNQGAKTHELIVKASQASGELALLPSTFDTEVNSLRTELNGLVADSSGYERIFQPVAAGAQPSADVAEAFRKLMRRGGELYRAFFGTASKSSSVRKAVDLVAGSSNQKIQVVRFDDHFVFPWTLLYDFPLPDERQGDPPLPLCLGQVVDANGVTVACSHTRKTSDFCVRGFWGVRHYVEELLVQGAGKATSISRPSKGPLRLVAASNLTESAALETALKTIESATEVGPPGGSALLDLLWADPPERPSILVFLAHLEKENKAGEPKGVRVFLGGTDWLTLNELSNRVTSGVAEWDVAADRDANDLQLSGRGRGHAEPFPAAMEHCRRGRDRGHRSGRGSGHCVAVRAQPDAGTLEQEGPGRGRNGISQEPGIRGESAGIPVHG